MCMTAMHWFQYTDSLTKTTSTTVLKADQGVAIS